MNPHPRRSAKLLNRAVIEALEGRRLLAGSPWALPGADGRLIYGTTSTGDRIPDFSQVGYKTGNVALPNTPGGVSVPVKRTINPGAPGVDMTAAIQAAIDDVEDDPMDLNGFRGAVLLTAGNYPIGGTLTINASGVVLMGQGDSPTTGTRLQATGTSQRFLIQINGSGSRSITPNTQHTISDAYVPVGARSFNVSDTTGLAVGDAIVVNRPSPANWIHDIGMDLLENPWQPGSRNQNWERAITGISGNTITIDVPLTNSLDQQYGGGTLNEYTWSGRITQVGVTDMYCYSDEASRTDLLHATGSINMDKVLNGWIRNVTSDKFAVNQIIIGTGSKYCTVDDVIIQNTSTGTQAPPAGLSINGVLNLAQNITMHGVYHAVALTSQVAGPNVVYNMTADGVGSDCGPHQRWSTGGLFDNVRLTGADLQANNRGNSGTGHGWAGANYVFWNCTARNFEISSPPTAQNWVIGGVGTKVGDGIFDQFGTTVQPPISLYQKQFWDRTHVNPTVVNAAAASPNPRTANTTSLSVLGGYNLGESNLTYTWACTSKPSGAPDPTLSANGTNGAKNTTATFTTPGTYVFEVVISDAGGLLARSSVIVTDRPTTTVAGDQPGATINDVIRIVRSGAFVDVFRNGANVLHQDYATSPEIVIAAGTGTDSITIDYTGGDPIPNNGLFVDGGSAADVVTMLGTSGNDAVVMTVGAVSVNGRQFGYTGAELLELALGAATDTLSVAGNAAVSATGLLLNLSGGGTVSMAAASTLPDFTDLSVASGTTFNINGQNQSVDALSGGGTVLNNGASAATLTVGTKNSGGTFAGRLLDGTAQLALTKLGSGVLTLTGANGYGGTSRIAGGVISAASAANFAGLAGVVQFDGGTFRVTGDTIAAATSNKFTTTYTGATSASTGAFDVLTGFTLTIGAPGVASMRTNGGGDHGGRLAKLGGGALLIRGNNSQQDDPFQLDAGTIILEAATGLGGGDSGVRVDAKSGTTLVLRQSAATNFLTPLNIEDPGGTMNVVLDRQSAGAGVTHALNALTSAGAFTLNVSTGAGATSGTMALTFGTVTLGGAGTINVTNGAAAATQVNVTGAISGAFGLTKTGNGTLNLSGANTYTGATTIGGGTFIIAAPTAAPAGNAVSVNAGTYRMTGAAGATFALGSLTIANGAVGQLTANGSATLKLTGLSISATGKLDLADNDLLIDYTGASPYATVKGYVVTGRNTGGASGIVTTATTDTALALVDNAVWGQSSFNGTAIDATTLIGKHTFFGDANLDGAVTGDDYLAIDANLGLGSGTRQWLHGDFNFDGSVTGDDYLAIDANLGKGSSAPLAFDEMQAEMVALHAQLYGGKRYLKAVEKLAKA